MVYRRNCHNVFVTVAIEIPGLEEHRILAIRRDTVFGVTWGQFSPERTPVEV